MYIMEEYDDILKKILKKGIRKSNRTGVDTLSLFGTQSRYKIDEYFPILTKRKLFPKSIFAELLWMLSGSTNVNDLEKMGSKIWTAWRDPEFEKRNNYNDGEFGPIYGWSFRHFGGDYSKRHLKDQNGFDQINYIVNELRTNKMSRRLLINLWDPNVMTSDKVRLPCCHYSFQLSVDNNDNLSGMLTQRSCDLPVGSPANIYFYSALIYMFAQQCNLNPYELIYSCADAHIYVNQINAVEEYLSRPNIDSPKLSLNKANDIYSYKLEDFVVNEYNPAPAIKFEVAV